MGIEEYLDGPLLSYINEQGYLAIGFESGQHTAKEAVDNSIAFMWLSLVYGGALKRADVDGFEGYYRQLQEPLKNQSQYTHFTRGQISYVARIQEFRCCEQRKNIGRT